VEVVAENLKGAAAIPGATVEEVAGQTIVKLKDVSATNQTLRVLQENGGTIVSVTQQRETLESYFTRQIKALGDDSSASS
jgi:hypothetical protein